MSSRHLQDMSSRRLQGMSSRRLGRRKIVTLKTCWRRLQDVFKTSKCLLGCNALIQPIFDDVCTAWFSDVSKRLKLRIQPSQNKCMRFCLQLDKRSKILVKDFSQVNRLKFMIETYNSKSLILLNFKTISFLTTLINFSVLYWLSVLPKNKATFLKNKTRNPMWKVILCAT